MALKNGKGLSGRDMKLSQILRMYYSNVGLPGNPEYKACNRLNLYQNFDKDELKKQVGSTCYCTNIYFNLYL